MPCGMRFLTACTLGPTLILGLWVVLVRPTAAHTAVPRNVAIAKIATSSNNEVAVDRRCAVREQMELFAPELRAAFR